MRAFVSKSQQNKKELLLHAVAVKVGAAASLGFVWEGSSFFGPAESWKMASWGSVVREGRGCRRLIEAEAEVTGAICLACVCRLKEERLEAIWANASAKESCRSKQSGILLRSIARFCMLSKWRETCEGRSGLVGPESHGRSKLNERIYYRILWITRGTLSISPPSTRWTA